MEIRIDVMDETDGTDLSVLLQDCAGAVFSELEAGFGDCEISVLITDDGRIRELNNTYRGKDTATDVLSFPMSEDPFEEGGVLGDIVISMNTAKKQAAEAEIAVEREIAFLFIHGLLHLMGYDHETDEEAEEEMFGLQEKILAGLVKAGKVS